MAICILVLKNEEPAYHLKAQLEENSLQLLGFDLVEPAIKSPDKSYDSKEEDYSNQPIRASLAINKLKINDVKLLNPKLSRRDRQKKMASWLMPFGFIAGLTFSGMTNLTTFSKLGFNPLGENILGGILGMGSGWIGSYFASASVNTYKEDIDALRQFNAKGFWLLILTTPFEIEIPWKFLQETNPIQIVNISDL